MPCQRCFDRNLVCAQQPAPTAAAASSKGGGAGGRAEEEGAEQRGQPAGDHGEGGAFLATFLERWNPAAVATALAEAVVGLLKPPPAWPRPGISGGAPQGLLEEALVEAAM